MKTPVLISFALHIFLIAALLVIKPQFRYIPKKVDVYQVELVSLPPVKNITMKKKEPVKTAPVVPAKPEQKEPDKAVATKPKKMEKKEPPQKTQESESKAAPGQTEKQVKVDTKDFPFSYYLNLLRYRVQENWRPPYQENQKAKKMAVTIGFQVRRNGRITDVVVESSSEMYLFDQAAQRAVMAAAPLPPLPEEFSEDHLSVHIEFETTW